MCAGIYLLADDCTVSALRSTGAGSNGQEVGPNTFGVPASKVGGDHESRRRWRQRLSWFIP
jgi:hypothetical protein